MNKKLTLLAIVVALAAVGVYAYFTSGGDNIGDNVLPVNTGTGATPPSGELPRNTGVPEEAPPSGVVLPEGSEVPQATTEISIETFLFIPKSITVKKGTTVTWTNKDEAAHNVVGEGGVGPRSKLLKKGEKYSYTFSEVGTFNYFCEPHPWMKASVIVTE